MISILKYSFLWLPWPLRFLVSLALTFCFIAVLFKVIKLVLELVKFVTDIFGMAISKVVSWFL